MLQSDVAVGEIFYNKTGKRHKVVYMTRDYPEEVTYEVLDGPQRGEVHTTPLKKFGKKHYLTSDLQPCMVKTKGRLENLGFTIVEEWSDDEYQYTTVRTPRR